MAAWDEPKRSDFATHADYEEYQQHRVQNIHRGKLKPKCNVCGLRLCVCQLGLLNNDWSLKRNCDRCPAPNNCMVGYGASCAFELIEGFIYPEKGDLKNGK